MRSAYFFSRARAGRGRTREPRGGGSRWIHVAHRPSFEETGKEERRKDSKCARSRQGPREARRALGGLLLAPARRAPRAWRCPPPWSNWRITWFISHRSQNRNRRTKKRLGVREVAPRPAGGTARAGGPFVRP